MANTLAPRGFIHCGYLEGQAPTYGLRRRKIALANTHPIFRGDAVISLSTGYIDQQTTNAVQLAGIFQGCEYYSISQQRKVRSWYWPGSDAQYDVDAFIIDADRALFIGQSNGSAIVIGNIGNNVGVLTATSANTSANFSGGSTAPVAGLGTGNTLNGISGMLLDVAGTNAGGSGAINTTSTLPFRIYDLYSNFVIQGGGTAGGTITNGADNTTNFNWAIVVSNNWDTKSLTGI